MLKNTPHDTVPRPAWVGSISQLFVLLGILAFTEAANAQVGGIFVPTGDMTTERNGHSATLLADGRVLILGGDLSGSVSAELYDPSTGTFVPTASARFGGSTATLLPNGKVLIAAGGKDFSSAELYDPATGKFTPTGDLIEAQDGPTATLLLNGKVLIAGGVRAAAGGHTDGKSARAELYDPATGTFSLTGDYAQKDFPYPFVNPIANMLGDGRVLLTGIGRPEVYDPTSGTFSFTGAVSEPAYLHLMNIVEWQAATSLKDGMVLISGGNDDGTCGGFSTAEIYDPSTDTFSFTGAMTTPRDLHSATLLNDGTVLLAGGGAGWCFRPTNDNAEIYNPAKRSFVAVGKMTRSRSNHTATLLKDGTVLIAGGFSYWPLKFTRTAELYRPATKPPTGRRRGRR